MKTKKDIKNQEIVIKILTDSITYAFYHNDISAYKKYINYANNLQAKKRYNIYTKITCKHIYIKMSDFNSNNIIYKVTIDLKAANNE